MAVYSGWADAGLGLSHVFIGQKENAEKILEGMLEKKKKTHVSSVCIGWLWGALGNYDKAYEERDTLMPFIHIYVNLMTPGIQNDPRFESVLRKMRLDD